MTLNDIVSENTHQLRHSRELAIEEIRRLGRQVQATTSKRQALQKSIKEEDIDGRQEQILDMEREINDLKSKIDELHQEKSNSVTGLQEAEQRVMEYRRKLEEAKREADDLQEKQHAKVAEKDGLESKLTVVIADSFDEYLSRLHNDVMMYVSQQEEMSSRLKQLERFKEERTKDPTVMELWEARQELKMLFDSSDVPRVKNKINHELDQIEQEIEKLFPGALSMVGISSKSVDVRQLYYGIDGNTNIIYLPIGPDSWRELRSKEADADLENACFGLVWAIGREMGRYSESMRMYCDGSYVILEYVPLDETDHPKSVNMPLPASKTLSLMLERLPQEVEVAILG